MKTAGAVRLRLEIACKLLVFVKNVLMYVGVRKKNGKGMLVDGCRVTLSCL